MDLVLLRTFTEVARRGSFSAAAAALGYTQSAVSQQIAALETSLAGTALLTRRPVAPTAAGLRLLEHAEPLLLRADAARADVLRAAGDPPERLSIAACPLALPRLAAACGAAMRRFPRLDLALTAAGAHAVAADVARGASDLGLVAGLASLGDPLRLPDVGPLRAVQIAADPVCVVLPADHPLAARPGLRLADLADARWIDAPAAAVGGADLRRALGTRRVAGAVTYTGADLAGLVALTAAGMGLTLLPAWAVAGTPGVTAVPVDEPASLRLRTEVLSGAAAATGPAGEALTALLGA